MIFTFGQSGGLKFHSNLCISSEQSITEFREIHSSLLKFGEKVQLHTRDYSEFVSKLEKNVASIKVEFKPRRFFPSYKLVVVVNPKRGGSSITLYGLQELDQNSRAIVSRLKTMLEVEYDFTYSESNDIHSCE